MFRKRFRPGPWTVTCLFAGLIVGLFSGLPHLQLRLDDYADTRANRTEQVLSKAVIEVPPRSFNVRQAIAMVEQVVGRRVQVDWVGLAERGVHPDDPAAVRGIEGRVKSAPPMTMLRAAVRSGRGSCPEWCYVDHWGNIVVSPKPVSESIVLDARHWIGCVSVEPQSEYSAEELQIPRNVQVLSLIQTMDDAHWEFRGCPGTLSIRGGIIYAEQFPPRARALRNSFRNRQPGVAYDPFDGLWPEN